MVALWQDPVDGGPGGPGDLLRLDALDPADATDTVDGDETGRVTRARWYYFCPETLTEAAGRLGWPARTHGYGR